MSPKRDARKPASGDVATNRRARQKFELLDRFECGIELLGTEVKALREGKAQLGDAYAVIERGEVWLRNAHIPPYAPASTAKASAPAADGDKLGTLREFKENAERMFLVGKLRENGWNISKTAEVIDTPRSNLYKKLEQYQISQETDG